MKTRLSTRDSASTFLEAVRMIRTAHHTAIGTAIAAMLGTAFVARAGSTTYHALPPSAIAVKATPEPVPTMKKSQADGGSSKHQADQIHLSLHVVTVNASRNMDFDSTGKPNDKDHGLSIHLTGYYTTPLHVLFRTMYADKIITGSGQSYKPSRSGYYYSDGGYIIPKDNQPLNIIAVIKPHEVVHSIRTIQSHVVLMVPGDTAEQLKLSPISRYLGKQLWITNMGPDAWVKVTGGSSWISIHYSKSLYHRWRSPRIKTHDGRPIKVTLAQRDGDHVDYSVPHSAVPNNGQIILRFWSHLKKVSVPYTLTNIALPSPNGLAGLTRRKLSGPTITTVPVKLPKADWSETHWHLPPEILPGSASGKPDDPITAKRLGIQFYISSIKQNELVTFDKKTGKPGISKGKITIDIDSRHKPGLIIVNSHIVSTDNIITGSGQPLFAPRDRIESEFSRRAYFVIPAVTPGPVTSLCLLQGRVRVTAATLPAREAVLVDIDKHLGKRVRVLGVGNDVWVAVTRGRDKTGHPRVRIHFSEQANNKLRKLWFTTRNDTQLDSVESGEFTARSYRVKLPADGKIVFQFWPQKETLTVPVNITDFHMVPATVTRAETKTR